MSTPMSNVARMSRRQIGAQSLTEDMLHSIMPNCPRSHLEECLPHLIAAMHEFDITTKPRAAAFLATIAVESGELKYFKELGNAAYFKKYEGRVSSLGNTQPGDGPKYKGRGAIQITGRANCEKCLKALHLPAGHPEVLETVEHAFRSAGWYWEIHHLNSLADKKDFPGIQRKVNGKFPPNHWDERQHYHKLALGTLPNGWTLTEGAEMPAIESPTYRENFTKSTDYVDSPASPWANGGTDDELPSVPSTVDGGEVVDGAGPYDPPVEVEAAGPAKERTTKSLVSTVTATLSSIGLTLGTLFTDGVNNLKENPELIILLALTVTAIIICYVMYQHRQTKLDLADKAHAMEVTLEMMKIRSDPGRINVQVVPQAVSPELAGARG